MLADDSAIQPSLSISQEWRLKQFIEGTAMTLGDELTPDHPTRTATFPNMVVFPFAGGDVVSCCLPTYLGSGGLRFPTVSCGGER